MRRARASASHVPFGEGRQNFAAESDRERLSPTAIRAVKAVAEQWGMKGAEMAALLGVSTST